MIRFDLVTVFPDVVSAYTNASILGRAQKLGLIEINIHNLRDWAHDKHHTVDDRVFGGGPGMLMKVGPLYEAITELREKAAKQHMLAKVIATAAAGNLFTQEAAQAYANKGQDTDMTYILLCGHYEGFDARVFEFVDETLSVGPYVLTGGELPALIIVDAVARLVPGVLGNKASSVEETQFSYKEGTIEVSGEHPQYTMPASFIFTDQEGHTQERIVPEVLRSGHHEKIKAVNDAKRVKKVLF